MSITVQPAENIIFTMDGKNGEGEQKISIPAYYRQFYSATVTKPRMPCVQVRHSASGYTTADRIADSELKPQTQYGKKAFIPIEFVRLADWNSLPPTKLTADQTAA
jgi:eukaryotic translation initiation factor 2C